MSVLVFDWLNLSDWIQQVQFHLCVLDIDMTLQVENMLLLLLL